MPRSLSERIERHSIPEPNSGCWLWQGNTTKKGYGRLGGGQAHRMSWTAFRGTIPEGMCVLHRCDNRACVNPDHLWLGTQIDNINDCVNKGRNRSSRGAHRGATFVKRNGRWQAQIGINGRTVYLGQFPSREQACAAHEAARALFVASSPTA